MLQYNYIDYLQPMTTSIEKPCHNACYHGWCRPWHKGCKQKPSIEYRCSMISRKVSETRELSIGCTSQSMEAQVCTATREKRKSSMLYVRKHGVKCRNRVPAHPSELSSACREALKGHTVDDPTRQSSSNSSLDVVCNAVAILEDDLHLNAGRFAPLGSIDTDWRRMFWL